MEIIIYQMQIKGVVDFFIEFSSKSILSRYSQYNSFLLGAGGTRLDEMLELIIVWYFIAVDQLGIVDEELLDASRQKVDVAEAFLGEHLGGCSAMPLVIHECYDDLVVQVLKSTKGLEVVVSVDPSMREAD